MQVVVNERLLKRKMRLSLILYLASMAAVLPLVIISWVAPEIQATYGYLVLPLLVPAFLFFFLAQSYIHRWGPRFRRDKVLEQGLKGLDDRHTLFAFVSSKLPDYLLLAPASLFVVVPRDQRGNIVCRCDHWFRETSTPMRVLTALFGNPLGNPSLDAARGLQQLQQVLKPQLSDGLLDRVPPQGLIVFINPDARLRLEGCSHTVVGLKELRGFLRRSKGRLTSSEIKRLHSVLMENMER